MKEYGNDANHLIQAMLTKAIEEISPVSCASRRVGMASEIGEVFLDPLLNQNGTKRTRLNIKLSVHKTFTATSRSLGRLERISVTGENVALADWLS